MLLDIPTTVTEVVFDYETGLVMPDGSTVASTEAYLPNFRVLSCGFSWRDGVNIVSAFVKGEAAVGLCLAQLPRAVPLIVHNYQFERMVTNCRYPFLKLNIAYDTMRLAQVYDNGGDKMAFEVVVDETEVVEYGEMPEIKKVPTAGLGLVKCLFRILGEPVSHKKEAHDWIRANVPEAKKGKEGKFLDRLPDDILERYNVGDTEATLRLYEFVTEEFRRISYDWSLDHSLYKSTADFVVGAKIRGVRVNRKLAITNRDKVEIEIRDIEQAFLTRYASQIAEVESDRLVKWLEKVKTEKGKAKRLAKFQAAEPKAVKEVKFNPGSNAQLQYMFMRKMGMVPKFFTKKGAPSLKSSLLSQWGEPGLMLQKRRKRLIILKQISSLIEVSAYNSRWYLDLKVAQTATGRLAGGQHG